MQDKYIRIIAGLGTNHMKIRLGVLLIFFGFTCSGAFAQDPTFSQFYANPIYLNPALAGSAVCPRAVLNYRNQWPGIAATFVTYSASYDQYVPGVKGGLGIQAYHDNAGNGTINTNSISGMYAYQAQLEKRVSIKAGFQATYYQRSIDWQKLTFGDQIHERFGFIYPTSETPIQNNVNKLDFSAGALVFTEKFYAGFAAHHLTQPDESFFKNTESRLPRKYTAHAGAMIPFDKRNPEDGAISPNIVFRNQGQFTELNLGLYVRKGPITGGVWYRTSDALIFLVGLQTDQFRFGYSYDITTSSLGTTSGGSHEISVTFNFPCMKKNIKLKDMKCPHF